MKRAALPLFIVAVAALSVISVLSWLQGKREMGVTSEDAPDPVWAEGMELASTADADQRQMMLALARAGADLGDETPAITVDYPLDGSIFPPEIVPPSVVW